MRSPALQDQAGYRTEHLTFADWLSGVLVRWRVVTWSVLWTFVAGGLAVLLIPAKYTGEASFVVNSASNGRGMLSSASSGLASLAGQFGISAGGDAADSPPFYTELLTSRELLTRLLETRFPDPRSASPRDSAPLIDLIGVNTPVLDKLGFHTMTPRRRMELAVQKLTKSLTPETNLKTPLLRIYVATHWPELSAAVANRAMEEVNRFNIEQRTSRARAKRRYLEQRLSEAYDTLQVAEGRHRDFMSGNRKFDFSPTLQGSDEQLRRNIDIAREEYHTLQQQYDAARLDEFNDAALITVVDSAVPPARATWPRYSWVVVGCVVLGLLIGVVIAGSMTVWAAWAIRNPESATRLTHAWRTARPALSTRERRVRRAAPRA